MIRELSVTEVEQVSGAGFWGDIWHAVKDAVHIVRDYGTGNYGHIWGDLKHIWGDLKHAFGR